VASCKQKDDFNRQVACLRECNPAAEFVRDIGSRINFKRKRLKAILERALRGHLITLVVAHRDRLARCGKSKAQNTMVRHLLTFAHDRCKQFLQHKAQEYGKIVLDVCEAYAHMVERHRIN
jgi:predicted site-specific integrase-resolvase